METNYKDEYEEKLLAGEEYEDFIAEKLWGYGIPIIGFKSRKFQIDRGENLLGLEIKFDRKMNETGNIYIETHEKSHPDNPDYTDSGIYRNDNSWLYGIGNYDKFFIFSKKYLQRIIENSTNNGCYEKKTPTSRGVVILIEKARIWADLSFEF